jgi:hypothetical protein
MPDSFQLLILQFLPLQKGLSTIISTYYMANNDPKENETPVGEGRIVCGKTQF